MTTNATSKTTVQPIMVDQTTVSCDGKGDTSGHPQVFIHLDADSKSAACPYCGQRFTLDPNAKVAGHH